MIDLVKHLLGSKVFPVAMLTLFGASSTVASAYLVVSTQGERTELRELVNNLQTQIAQIEPLTLTSGTEAENLTDPAQSVQYLTSELIAGSGITIVNNLITNTDTGSTQSIFKEIKVADNDTIKASLNGDSLTFVSGSGIGLSTDATNKKITINNTVTSSALNGWTSTTGLVYPSDTSSDVAIGGSSSLGKLSITGDSDEKQLVLRGYSGQTTSLFDLQNSSGTSLANFSSSGVLSLPSNGLTVGTSQLVVANGRVGIGTSSPSTTLDVNGNAKLSTNSTLTLTSDNSVGTITRLLTLKATTKYDRPWISNVDYTGRHVISYGQLDTNNDDIIHKRFELKTVASSSGPQPEVMLTRLAIEYDTELADIIFGQVDTIGVHNNYGDKIQFVQQMRDAQDLASHAIGQWVTELGTADSTVMTLDPKTLTSTEGATLRFFRETNTSGTRRFSIMKGDGTSTETFGVNPDTGATAIAANSQSLTLGDGTNVAAYVNVNSNRTLFGYDGSSATLQAGTNKSIKFNVNASSFGQGTVMTILSTGNVGVGTTNPLALFSVGTGSPFQVNSSGAVAAATGLVSSGTITFSGLNTNYGLVYANGGTLAQTTAGSGGECLVSGGSSSAPTWSSCAAGGASQWTLGSGAVYVGNTTADVLIGATSTASAKFGFINVTSGTPTATIAGNLTLNSAGVIQSTRNQALVVGGDSTGNIALQPLNGAGRVGIGTTNPLATLHVSGSGETLRLGDGANTTSYMNIQANRTMTGYDGSFAVLQGGTSKGVKLNVNNASFGQGTAMTILSNGNVGMGTTNPTLGPLEMASGAYVSVGGSWENSSDRNLKENFTPLNADEILQKISQLEITQWNYKTEADSVRHIGPVAQDFYGVFGLGNTDRAISTIDPAGIALLGIQGLQTKLNTLTTAVARSDKSIVAAPITVLPELTVEGNLAGLGDLALQGKLTVKGESLFEKLVTFVSNVIFKGRVTFEKVPVFSQDTAGQAIVKQGADQVRVNFGEKYEAAPQITANLISTSNESEATIFNQDLKFVIKEVNAEGFTLKLNKTVEHDVAFSWMALYVASPQTSVGAAQTPTSPTSAPVTSPSPSPITSPSPAVSGVTDDTHSSDSSSSATLAE